MGDLLLGIAVVLFLSVPAYIAGGALSRRAPMWLAATAGIVTLGLLLCFVLFLHGRLMLAHVLPFSGAIVLANWIPPGAALLAGLIGGRETVPAWRRRYVSVMLIGLAWYTIAYDVFGPSPQTGTPRFEEGVCMQTTSASCSACCAVSLLMTYEIPATEAEMIERCLTRTIGTPELGLYRGLKIKTRNTDWDVEVFHGDLATLRQLDGPCLLLYDSFAAAPSDRVSSWRFKRSTHALVVFGFTDDGRIEVGDPSTGRRRWTVEQLRTGWYGDGIRIVPRYRIGVTDGLTCRPEQSTRSPGGAGQKNKPASVPGHRSRDAR